MIRPARNGVLIRIEHLAKTYKLGEVDVHALRGVSLDVRRGEFVAIMGASGSGKSTFMNIIGCLDTPTKGGYKLEDIDVSKLSRDELAGIRNAKIGFVFQGFNLLSRTSALENVELPLLYLCDAEQANATTARSRRLSAWASRTAPSPSQPAVRRTAAARGHRPGARQRSRSILLADEPTGNLDSRTSEEVMGIFQELNSTGITIIMVTHEPDIAQFTKRQIVFRDGKIRSDGQRRAAQCRGGVERDAGDR